MRTIVKFWMTVSMVLLVSACGYKPSSHMIQHVFSDTVYVEVIVDRAEPENAPYVKDEMNRLVYTDLKAVWYLKKRHRVKFGSLMQEALLYRFLMKMVM